MHFTNFTIRNYKSYRDPQSCVLRQGITLLVGANNSGKSALIDMLSLDFEDKKYKDLNSNQNLSPEIENGPTIEFSFQFSRSDLSKALERKLGFPVPQYEKEAQKKVSKTFSARLTEWCRSLQGDVVQGCLLGSSKHRNETVITAGLPTTYPYTIQVTPNNQDEETGRVDFSFHTSPTEEIYLRQHKIERGHWFFTNTLIKSFKKQIYRFSAQRFNSHKCPHDEPNYLKSDASNLPKVIRELDGEFGHTTNAKFKKYTKQIFPRIFDVGASSEGKDIRIWVWPVEPSPKMKHLKIPLEDCGNGIGQVLAILYILVTASEPQTILIDEPTSFLHSTSIRKLMEILSNYPQHQIIIATHSPLVVNTVNVASVIRVSQEDRISQLEHIEPPSEYGYQGWTVEEILQDVMQFDDTRSTFYQSTINKFDQALDDENPKAAKEAYDQLDKMLHPENHMRKLLKIQMTSLAGLEDDQD